MRRARALGSRAGAECRICAKPTRKTPPTDSSRSRVELIVNTGRPCASVVEVMAVRTEECSSPSAVCMGGTGSKRYLGFVMPRSLSGASSLTHTYSNSGATLL